LGHYGGEEFSEKGPNVLNCVQHSFSRGGEKFSKGGEDPCAPIVTGLNVALQIGKASQVGSPRVNV